MWNTARVVKTVPSVWSVHCTRERYYKNVHQKTVLKTLIDCICNVRMSQILFLGEGYCESKKDYIDQEAGKKYETKVVWNGSSNCFVSYWWIYFCLFFTENIPNHDLRIKSLEAKLFYCLYFYTNFFFSSLYVFQAPRPLGALLLPLWCALALTPPPKPNPFYFKNLFDRTQAPPNSPEVEMLYF